MFCPKCGSNQEDDAQFCGVCGEAMIPQQQTTPTPVTNAPAQSYATMPQTAAPAIAQESKNKRLIIITAAIISVIVIASIAFSLVFSAFKNKEQMAPRPIQVFIEAQGYSDQCTKIPVSIAGTDSTGTSVDTVGFIDGSGNGLELAPGSYELSFPASPLTPDGILYEPPSKKAQITVDKDSDKAAAVNVFDDDPAAFKKMTAGTETDKMIEDAYEYAIMDDEQVDKADELRIIATDVHDKAVEEERQRQAAEAARTIDMPYYTIKIPEYWVGKVDVFKNGNTVYIAPKGYTKDDFIILAELMPTEDITDGDYLTFRVKDVSVTNGQSAVIYVHSYAGSAAEAVLGHGKVRNDSLSNAAIQLLSGGTLTLSEVRNAQSKTSSPLVSEYSRKDASYISNNVTLTAK